MTVGKPNFFSFCEINATKFGTKIKFHLISFGLYHAVEIDQTVLLLMFVAEKVLLLSVISLTALGEPQELLEPHHNQYIVQNFYDIWSHTYWRQHHNLVSV